MYQIVSMQIRLRFYAVLLMLLLPVFVLAQFSAIEQARHKLYAATTDAEQLGSLEAIAKYANALPADSIAHYALLTKELALRLNDGKRLAQAEYSLVAGKMVKGKTDSVILEIDGNAAFKGLGKSDRPLYYKLQLLKANALNRLNKRTEALELQLKILDEAEKEGNISTQLYALNYIGATYLNIAKPAEARQTWLQALSIIKEKGSAGYHEIEAYILSNLALYYFNNYGYGKSATMADSFLTHINQTIQLALENEIAGVLASALVLRGNYYGMAGQFANGEKDFTEGLAIRKQIGDPLYILNDITSLANFYYSQREYDKCIANAQWGLALADSNGIKGEQVQLIGLISYAHKATGDYKRYAETLEQYIKATTEHNQLNAAEKIATIQTKYEVQKKETLIAQQQLDLFRRKIFLWGGSIATVLLLVFLAFRFKKYQRQERIKLAAMMEEEKRQNEAAVKEAEEKERKRIAAELHDNLGVQANAILHNSSLLQETEPASKAVVADLQDTAKDMLLNLRETLWALKAADATATDLWLRIINFMQQMGRHYTILRFTIGGDVPADMLIPSGKALNILLVLQEAVNNAVKHAGATTIAANSRMEKGNWVITVTDDGKGFDKAAVADVKDSYGLTNMQARATASAIALAIDSGLGKGTMVTLTV